MLPSAETSPPPAPPVRSTFGTGETRSEALASGGDQERMYRQNACIYNNAVHTIISSVGYNFTYVHAWLDLANLAKKEPQGGWPGGIAPVGTDRIDPTQLTGDKWQSQAFDHAGIDDMPYQQSVGLAAAAGSMYAVYAATKSLGPSVQRTVLMSRAFGPISTSPAPVWQDELMLHGTDNFWIIAADGGVAISFYGDDQMLMAVSGEVQARTFRLYLFDLMDRDTSKPAWTAQAQRIVSFDELTWWFNGQPIAGFEAQSTGNDIGMDWFAVPPGTGGSQPTVGLAVNLTPGGTPGDYSFTGTFPLSIDPATGKIIGIDGQTFHQGDMKFDTRGDGSETDLRRDPAGRLRTFVGPIQRSGSPYTNSIASTFINTGTWPQEGNGFNRVNFPTPAYVTTNQWVKPAADFYLFEQGAVTSQVGDFVTNDIPVLEFVIYGDGYFQVGAYGTIRTMQFTRTLEPKVANQNVIAGIIDGPIPFPLQNFSNDDLKDVTSLNVGDFIYGTESESETGTSVETDWSYGVETSVSFTKGLGPALKASLESGMGSVQSDSVSTSLSRELSVGVEVDYNPNGSTPIINGTGAVLPVSAALAISAYQFYDVVNTLVNDAATSSPACGPKIAGALVAMQGNADQLVIGYTPYIGQLGDLTSYTPEAVQAKMAGLGYKGKDYFQDVIVANAYPFQPSQSYLEYTWDGTNSDADQFTAFASSYNEQSWTFDTSLYAGLSGGGGVSLFGMGEEMEFEVLGGFTYSHDHSTEATQSNSWGLSLKGIGRDWGPPTSGDEAAVRSYTFRAYFLPVPSASGNLPSPTYWLEELINCLPPSSELQKSAIDPHSGCWRIAFFVTQITWNSESAERKNYAYKDPD